MTRRSLTLIVLLVVIIAFFIFVSPVLVGPGGRNLINNGSFETGNFADSPGEPFAGDCSCKLLCAGSPSLDSWQVSKGGTTSQTCDSARDAVAWLPAPNRFNIGAQDGARFLDLTGDAGRPPSQYGGVQQTVEGLQVGNPYELSFAIGSAAQFPPAIAPNKVQFYDLTVEAAALPGGKQTFNPTAPTSDVTHWDQHTIRFNATAPTMTVVFTAFGSADSNGQGGAYIGLDNVVLQKVCFLGRFLGCS